jgi:hypothetical protein
MDSRIIQAPKGALWSNILNANARRATRKTKKSFVRRSKTRSLGRRHKGRKISSRSKSRARSASARLARNTKKANTNVKARVGNIRRFTAKNNSGAIVEKAYKRGENGIWKEIYNVAGEYGGPYNTLEELEENPKYKGNIRHIFDLPKEYDPLPYMKGIKTKGEGEKMQVEYKRKLYRAVDPEGKYGGPFHDDRALWASRKYKKEQRAEWDVPSNVADSDLAEYIRKKRRAAKVAARGNAAK